MLRDDWQGMNLDNLVIIRVTQRKS